MDLGPTSITTTFPQAPLRSHTVGFPESYVLYNITNVVLTLAYPPNAFPVLRKLKCWRILTPLSASLHAGLGLATELLPSLVDSTRPPGTQSPFARRQLLPPAVWCPAPHQRALPLLLRSYRLMRQTKSLPPALVQPPPVGLCRFSPVPTGRWSFPTLSLQSLRRCLDPYPVVFCRCTCSFLPGRQQRPHVRTKTFGTPIIPAMQLQQDIPFEAAVISLCSGSPVC